MEPVYVDLHIHTSEDPEKLNHVYDIELLKSKIDDVSEHSPFLISLTDHNTINKPVYLRAATVIENLLLGVELHVLNYETEKPYHCHIFFNLPAIDGDAIDSLNKILDELYPRKVILPGARVPRLEEIMKSFDAYEFIMLPHGGQNHSTFDKSIPEGVQFDNTIERSIYYNHFDGFTARSNTGLERTLGYFKRLGISDFTNLVTASDNYNPSKYPGAKDDDASPFIRTWMLARPTFSGLRLSLSESSRLMYGNKPDLWAECIKHVSLKNDSTDIDVDLTPGLNVVIGGSSSGKTLFVDSLVRTITGELEDSPYINTPYLIQDIQVRNPAGQTPHYLPQNYIMKVCDHRDKENKIEDISILRSVFPADAEERQLIENGLQQLNARVSTLVDAARKIASLQETLSRIPKLSHLIVTEIIRGNPLRHIRPNQTVIDSISYGKSRYERHVSTLDEIDQLLTRNPLIEHNPALVINLKEELRNALERSDLESKIRSIIADEERVIDEAQQAENLEVTTKRQHFEKLLGCIREYMKFEKQFFESLAAISQFSIKISTTKISSMGHNLFIDNEFELTKGKFLEVVNALLKTEHAITSFENITPESLCESRFRKRAPKVADYDDFAAHIKNRFVEMNRKTYRITTKDGKNFETLSAGWKTSVILDLILGWESDNAPLIIDQPEDNLATNYINGGLLEAIKKCKTKKQVILVSHNATIPMLGDAQNVIYCRNDDKKISIRSSPLEGNIGIRDVVDIIAETTDGGKSSVKKRVKKYNLKSFRS